jgi:hypothetical protein
MNDRVSTPLGGPEPDQRREGRSPERVRKVGGKVEVQGQVIADGVADLSVAADRSWSATWSSPEPWPASMDRQENACEVRFEGISPILEGMLTDRSSGDSGQFELKVVGQNWPETDFE